MKSYSKSLVVDWVWRSCKFLAGIEMYVQIWSKTSDFILKKWETQWRNDDGLKKKIWGRGGDGMNYRLPSATEFPLLMATNGPFHRHPCPRQFSPPKKVCHNFCRWIRRQWRRNFTIPSPGTQRRAKIRQPYSVANSVANVKIPLLINCVPSLIPSLFGLFLVVIGSVWLLAVWIAFLSKFAAGNILAI